MKYEAFIEYNIDKPRQGEMSQEVGLLVDAWKWFCSEYSEFIRFFETPGQFRYWYGHKRTIGEVGDIVKAGICTQDGLNLFRFRLEKLPNVGALEDMPNI